MRHLTTEEIVEHTVKTIGEDGTKEILIGVPQVSYGRHILKEVSKRIARDIRKITENEIVYMSGASVRVVSKEVMKGRAYDQVLLHLEAPYEMQLALIPCEILQ